jgi:error-prone DNA polymerase
MPEQPPPKHHAHPYAQVAAIDPAGVDPSGRTAPRRSSRHVELAVTSNFTFLTGASHPEELVEQAASLGYEAIAITDRHTLGGVVRAHIAARERGIRLIVGSRIAVRLDVVASPDESPDESHTSAQGRIHPPQEPSYASQWAGAAVRTRVRRPRRMRTCELLLHATDLASYAGLCRLLTRGKRRAAKGACILHLHDLLEEIERIDAGVSSAAGSARSGCGLLCTLIPPPATNAPAPDDDGDRSSRRHWLESWDDLLLETVRGLRGAMGDRLSLAVSRLGEPNDEWRVRQTILLGEWTGVPIVAINDVHYHTPERRPLQDVLACIRRGCTVESAGAALFPNAERFLRPPEEMADLFRDMPEAIDRVRDLAERAAGFSLDQLRYRYPSEVVPADTTPMEHLRRLAWRGAEERYPQGVSERVRRQIEHELRLIDELDYASYFLTVHDLVAFARGRGILCQGRGAAANSAVCYCLGVTAVDPDRIDVLFERFVSKERNEPPDIDIDFEHERREEVIQYLYRRYGRDRAALAAEVISYRGRSAVRDVGKALGLSLDLIERFVSGIDWWQDGAADVARVRELGLDPHDPIMRWLARLTTEILGFPRHRSQHVGGFVITDGPLCEFVPIENAAMEDRTVIEWDKDDIDAMGMLKVDVLGLGILTCIRKCIDLVNESRPPSDVASSTAHPLRFHEIPAEDPEVYDMICAADTVGVFQIESRAQMSMLPRLRPRCFYDLVIEVAIVRPGPIQGDMVHPYLRRRNGEEPISYPDEAVRAVLGKTLGVPLFQEQAMSLAIVAAGFTPGEADQLRRAIAAWKRKGSRLAEFAAKLEEGMVSRGYTRAFAQQVFRQIQGFSGYGFPESHAASFALLVYASAWLKRHHPAAFAAALINSQPMGFYAPAQIVRDAIDHGVEVRGVDVNASAWNCTLEWGPDPAPDRTRRRDAQASPVEDARSAPALRLGMRLVRGLRHDDAERIASAVAAGGTFATLEELRRRSGISIAALRRLASADACRSMGLDRQHARWRVQALRDESLPLFDGPIDVEQPVPDRAVKPALPVRAAAGMAVSAEGEGEDASSTRLPPVPEIAAIAHDYATTGLSLKRHPMACIRPRLAHRGVSQCALLRDPLATPPKRRVRVAGIVLVRQRPSTANGIVFMTLEDESGIANLIIRPRVYARCRRAARSGVILLATGRVERRDGVVHLLAERMEDISAEAARLGGGFDPMSRDFR